MTPKHRDYNSMPKEKDCIHVVAITVDATSVTSMSTKLLEKLRLIVQHANERGMILRRFVYLVPNLYYSNYMIGS